MSKNQTRISIISSFIGFLFFVIFYAISAYYYPGGSYPQPEQVGFSFNENYLCDLLDDIAIDGASNSGKIYARISLGFLCLGILLFWLHIPKLFSVKSKPITLMRVSGILAMLITVFLGGENHDLITRLAGLFGTIAFILAIYNLYKTQYKAYSYFGILCLVMILLNYYSYETGLLRFYLPLFQKLTMIAGIAWFIGLNLKLYRQLD